MLLWAVVTLDVFRPLVTLDAGAVLGVGITVTLVGGDEVRGAVSADEQSLADSAIIIQMSHNIKTQRILATCSYINAYLPT